MKQSSLTSFFSPKSLDRPADQPVSASCTPSKSTAQYTPTSEPLSTPIKRTHHTLNSSPFRTPTQTKLSKPTTWPWLAHPKDAVMRPQNDPNYDPTTLYIPKQAFQSFTNMEKQFWTIKQNLFDTILFFQKGKFYELYATDADIAHQQFNMTLANRSSAMRMCGVPLPSFDSWAQRFTSHGFKIAKVDQGEDVGKMKSRSLTRVYTPGTLFELDMDPLPSYICAVDDDQLVLLNTSTATLYPLDCEALDHHLISGEIKQVILPNNNLVKHIQSMNRNVQIQVDPLYFTASIKTFPPFINTCCNALMHILQDVKLYDSLSDHLVVCDKIPQHQFPLLPSTMAHVDTGSLFSFLDHTNTPMGKRLLKQWIHHPLSNAPLIIQRQEAIQSATTPLHCPIDIPKIMTRIAAYAITPKSLLSFLKYLEGLDKTALSMPLPHLMLPLETVQAICDGQYTNDEIEAIQSNQQDLCRIAQSHLTSSQTYVEMHGDPFIIQSTKPLQKTLHSKTSKYMRYTDDQTIKWSKQWTDMQIQLEAANTNAFQEILNQLCASKNDILKWSDAIAYYDALYSCYKANETMPVHCTPAFKMESGHLHLTELGHPLFPSFVPNSIDMHCQQMLLTGTNMGGKSTLLRQVGVAVLMAQVGLDVACKSYHCSVFDQLMTRVGAQDDMVRGHSTFQMEIMDVLSMIDRGTKDTLLLLDEFGRGTSSADGEALAKAVIEYFQERGNIVLFATHYKLDIDACHFYMDYTVDNEDMVFLYRLKRGVCPSSCGLHVARIAKLPLQVLQCAQRLVDEGHS